MADSTRRRVSHHPLSGLRPTGAGRLDAQAERLLAETGAGVAVVITFGGGPPGFSVSATDPRYLDTVPHLLETLAQAMRDEAKAARVARRVHRGGGCMRTGCCAERDQSFASGLQDIPPFHRDCDCVMVPEEDGA